MITAFIYQQKDMSVITEKSHESWTTVMTSNYINNIYNSGDFFKLIRNSPNNYISEYASIYTSYPPGLLIIPLAIRAFSEKNIDTYDLIRLNLLFYALGIILLFYISDELLSHFSTSLINRNLYSTATVVVYATLPATLGYQVGMFNYEAIYNSYLLFFLYFTLRFGIYEFVKSHRALYFISGFLLCYTDWSGYFLLSLVFLYFLVIRQVKGRLLYQHLLLSVLPAIIAILLFMYQVIHSSSLSYITDKFLMRIGLTKSMDGGNIVSSDSNFMTIFSYIETYTVPGLFYVFIIGLVVALFVTWKTRKNIDFLVVPLVILPWSVLLKLFVFSGHTTGHTFSILGLTIPMVIISVSFVYVIFDIISKHGAITSKWYRNTYNIMFLMVVLASSIINIASYKDKFNLVRYYNEEALSHYKLIMDKNSILVTHGIALPSSPPQLAYLTGKNGVVYESSGKAKFDNVKKEHLVKGIPPDYLSKVTDNFTLLGGGLSLWK